MICWKTDNSGLCYLDLPNCQGDGGVHSILMETAYLGKSLILQIYS